jgi:hypothetical protein
MPVLERLALPAPVPKSFSFRAFRGIERAVFASTLRVLQLQGHRWKRLVEVLPALPALEELDLIAGVVDARFAALPQRFVSLDFQACKIDDETANAFARSRVFSALRDLNVSYNPCSETALAALLASPNVGPLERLTVGAYDIEGGPLLTTALAHARARTTLERLSVACSCTEAAVRILVETDYPRLRDLSFGRRIAGAALLAHAPWIGQLEMLSIPVTSLDTAAATALAHAVSDTAHVMISGPGDRQVLAPLRERLGKRLLN